jgi:aryl-alcohol dehydrogenase-like predicted oxidoreductase
VETISLGRTDLRVNRLGLGIWQWGDRTIWAAGPRYDEHDMRAAFDTALAAGITFFDTAELYGGGQSERYLGRFLRETGATATVATKYGPFPWRWSRGDLLRALRASLTRLGLPRVDLYQIHWPPAQLDAVVEALGDAVEAGLTRAVGVSNFSAAQMRRAHARLARRGTALASNQVEYSLLCRAPERNGVLAACRELGVTLIAYSPIAKGLLTGKYTPASPPPGIRGWRTSRAYLARLQPLTGLLREIGQTHGGKTATQVALNWLLQPDVVPIPGIKNARQAQDNIGALGWELTSAEHTALAAASEPLQARP